jgi:phage-related protein
LIVKQQIVMLHGFIKKTQKTPDKELKLAKQRMKEFKK